MKRPTVRLYWSDSLHVFDEQLDLRGQHHVRPYPDNVKLGQAMPNTKFAAMLENRQRVEGVDWVELDFTGLPGHSAVVFCPEVHGLGPMAVAEDVSLSPSVPGRVVTPFGALGCSVVAHCLHRVDWEIFPLVHDPGTVLRNVSTERLVTAG